MGKTLIKLDFPNHRMYFYESHWHHGATGMILLFASQRSHGWTRRIGQTAGLALMLHDRVDWPWFGVK